MTTVALSQNGRVVAVQAAAFPELPIAEQFHSGLSPTDVTNVTPQPQVGWTATPAAGGGWTFTPPPAPPPPTPAQAAQAAYNAFISAGLTITSASTPAINGAYAIDAATQNTITTEGSFVAAFTEFSTGSTTDFPWTLPNGTTVVFPTTSSFMAVVKAIGQTVTAAKLALGRASSTMPSNVVTIA